MHCYGVYAIQLAQMTYNSDVQVKFYWIYHPISPLVIMFETGEPFWKSWNQFKQE